MAPVLVTGGTGTLGRLVVARLRNSGTDVRVLSRRRQPAARPTPVTWATGDLCSNVGIDAALAQVAAVIHCATGLRGDVEAARNLIEAVRRAEVPHLVYISIVGVDRVPLGYYRSKFEVEGLIEDSGLPWTVLRAKQFHDLILGSVATIARSPVMPVPAKTSFQPIDAGEVADRLVELAGGPPAGRVPDMGGPQILSASDLARTYLRASHRRRLVVPVRIPGAAFAGFRRGLHLSPDHAVGRRRFEKFLDERFATARGTPSDPRPVEPS